MACKVDYDKNGKINKVYDQNGQTSKLFTSIAKLPHMNTLEEALEVYKNTFTKKFYSLMGERGAQRVNRFKESLNEAKKLELEGKDYSSTGWFKENNQWKYFNYETLNNIVFKEISQQTQKIGDIIDEDILFETYPELANFDFSVISDKQARELNYDSSTKAVFDMGKREISLIRRDTDDLRGDAVLFPIVLSISEKQSILHEMAHFVQKAEGFPRGGDTETVLQEAYSIAAITKTDSDFDIIVKIANFNSESVEDMKVIRAAKKAIDDSFINGSNEGFYDSYRKLFGEVEARFIEHLYNKIKKNELKEGFNYAQEKLNFLTEEGIKEGEQLIIFNEPNLNFKSSLGNSFTTYREALLDSTGGDIEISIGNIPVLYVSSNTNVSEVGGFINNNIKSGILSDERIIDQGESFLKAEGYDETRQIVNEVYLREDAIFNLGGDSITIHNDGRVELRRDLKTLEIEGREFDKTEVEKLNYPQLNERLSEDAAITTSIHNALKNSLNRKTTTEVPLSEDTLKLKLLDLLNKMGVKVMSISNYIEAFNTVNGVDPSANALADIGNQIAAFKNGDITTEDLSEETAHFIVEAWDENEIENILRNIHKTESYAEFVAQYTEIYTRENPSMTSEEIDKLVRKEILGKELAKALQLSFNTENKTGIQKNIWQRLYQLVMDFFGRVANDSQFYTDLENLTSKVEDLLLSEDINNYLNLGNLQTKKFKMYSLKSGNTSIDSVRELTRRVVVSLLEQEKTLRSAKKGSQANVEQLKDLERKLNNQMEEALLAKSVSDVLALAHRQTKYVNDALTSADKKGETLTNEESLVLHSLTDQTVPILAQMKDMSANLDSKIFKRLQNDIAKVNDDITTLKGRLANTENDILNRVVDRLMTRHRLPDVTYNKDGSVNRNVKQELLDSLKEAKKDTNLLFAYYGQITHARDPLLNMLGAVIGDIFTTAEQSHLNRAKTLQDQMSKNGFKAADAKEFIKGKWITSLWDWEAFENKENEVKAETLSEVSGKTKEELLDKNTFIETLQTLTEEQNSEYQTKSATLLREERENSFNDKYYQERENKLKELGVSKTTQSALRKLSIDRGEIVSKATVEGGRPRYTLQDKYNLDFLNIKRKNMKSIFDADGTLKIGVVEDVNGKVEFEGKKYSLIEGASDEGTIAYEMHIIDNDYVNQLNNKEGNIEEGLAKSFEEELSKITDQEEAREFFLMNTNIGFSNEFWESFDNSDSFINRIESFAARKVGNLDIKVEEYKEAVSKRNNILKRYKDSRNTTNIVSEAMSPEIKTKVITLSEEIDELARVFTSQKDFPKSETTVDAETTPNESYYGALRDGNLTTDDEKLEFAMNHLTPSTKKQVRNLNDALDNLNKGRVLTTPEINAIERATGLKPEQINLNRISTYKLHFAESKLAPYYKAFAPTGLSQAMRQMESGEKTVVEVVEDLKSNPDIKLTNHYSYYENSEIENKNEDKIADFAGGYVQPKLSKYLNKDFVNLFAPKRENGKIVIDENGDIIPTINEKKYQYYKLLMDYQKESLKSYGELGRHNAYLAPQVSKQNFETISDLVNRKNKGTAVKEWWRDISQFRADDLATGAEVDGKSLFKGSGIKVIPKYFLNRLEDDNSVSQDLFYTLTAFAQQSELYKSRLGKFHEVAVLQDSLIKRTYPDGKKAETTSTYKIAQNYIDGSIFGIREIRDARVNLPFFGEVNLTQIIDKIHKFMQNRNLAFNVIIPATSWLTAETTLLLERWIGQYIDGDSYRRANRELRKLGVSSLKESFEIDSKSKMSIMGEYFGVFDLDNKFKNSAYSKGVRFTGRMGYILHTAANFTPISKALLSNLYGHRLYNNEFVDFNQFKTLQNKSGKDKKTVNADWNALENKTLYNYIKIDEATNTMTYSYEQIAKDMGVEYNEEFLNSFRERELAVTAKIRKLVELIDGNIPQGERTLLQRDLLGRFTMTHSSWLAITLARRFKSNHYSLQTGLEEEGTYVSLGKFLTRALNGMTKDGYKAFKNEYENANEAERANLSRVLKDVAFLQGLFLLSIGWGAFADDDENKDIYAIQAAAYLLDRTVSETSSSQFGVMGEVYQKLESPIVGLKQLKDMMTIKKVWDFDEVERGSYKGLTNSQAYLVKTIPGLKGFRDVWSGERLKTSRDTYNFYSNQPDFILANSIIDKESLK